MAQIQELIDRIKQEGVQTAEQKGREIEKQAKERAELIIQDARKKAEDLTAQAFAEIKKKEESGRMALRQASRDTVLALKKELQNMMHKLVSVQIRGVLTPDILSAMIAQIMQKSIESGTADQGMEMLVAPDQLDALRNGILGKLQEEVKKAVTVKASDEVGAGLMISFDQGRSCFEFTEKNLAEFLSVYLNKELGEIVKN